MFNNDDGEAGRETGRLKIVIPGGSGQVGTLLARAFHADGHEVVVLSRGTAAHARRPASTGDARDSPAPQPWRVVPWDGRTLDAAWASELDGSDVVINLAGRSVNCRYTAANQQEILASRVLSTAVVGQAIGRASRPPRVWLQASTATIYAHRFDAANDELTGLIGGEEPDVPPAWRFSIDVARAWERACGDAVTPHTRKVILRSAMTMSPDAGGIFDTLLGLVRRGLGGQAGDGRQFLSWIHETDFVRAVRWLIEQDGSTVERGAMTGGDALPSEVSLGAPIEGVVNLASPNPLPNAEFMRVLRAARGVPIGLPATRWMLEVGAVLMRTETELVLKSRRVVPRRLLDSGFVFTYPDWTDAARELCGRRARA